MFGFGTVQREVIHRLHSTLEIITITVLICFLVWRVLPPLCCGVRAHAVVWTVHHQNNTNFHRYVISITSLIILCHGVSTMVSLHCVGIKLPSQNYSFYSNDQRSTHELQCDLFKLCKHFKIIVLKLLGRCDKALFLSHGFHSKWLAMHEVFLNLQTWGWILILFWHVHNSYGAASGGFDMCFDVFVLSTAMSVQPWTWVGVEDQHGCESVCM